ncbi:MAG: dTDP-4-dehydrorhamnose reductase [Chitinophagaceae bacterium]|jgi:dTDP-4-dehydrorhamnose reductase|nr:dTDP-4-dehydrorhamnose reductase [Chitinophagaceae bacterium]
MSKKIIAVTGRNGQLGSELYLLQPDYSRYNWNFTDNDEMDLKNADEINAYFEKVQPDFFINCAAYTAVDKAEYDKENAYAINATAVKLIAENCKKYNTKLIQISTDYVFNGNGIRPYLPDEPTEPVNYYGFSKREGERLALENNPDTIVLRSAWIYSSFGKNFVKTMLHLMNTRSEISVVHDQTGSPTYAHDLAKAIMEIISTEKVHRGIYHFTNEGVVSWFDFAVAIRDFCGLNCTVNPIATAQFPTPAKRPAYSVLDKFSLQKTFGIELIDWKNSLEKCLACINNTVN